jgi:hypothetical protein
VCATAENVLSWSILRRAGNHCDIAVPPLLRVFNFLYCALYLATGMGIVIISSRGCWRYRLMIAEKGERHFLNLKSRYNRKNSASVAGVCVCALWGSFCVSARAM